MFDWGDYLRLAEDLHDQDQDIPPEAEERSAISRAYYAAFHEALRYAPAHVEDASNKHWALIKHYEAGHNAEEREVGRLLKALRDNRNMADYDQEIGGPAQCMFKASSSIRMSKRICSELSELYE